MNHAGLCALIAVAAVSSVVVLSVGGLVYYQQPLNELAADALKLAIGGLLTIAGSCINGRASA